MNLISSVVFFFTRFFAEKGGVVSTNRAIGKFRFHTFPFEYLTQSPFVTSWFLLIVVAFTSINMSSELFYPVFGSFMKDFAIFTQHQRVITVSCVVEGLKCAQCDLENFQIFQCAGVSIFFPKHIYNRDLYGENDSFQFQFFTTPSIRTLVNCKTAVLQAEFNTIYSTANSFLFGYFYYHIKNVVSSIVILRVTLKFTDCFSQTANVNSTCSLFYSSRYFEIANAHRCKIKLN